MCDNFTTNCSLGHPQSPFTSAQTTTSCVFYTIIALMNVFGNSLVVASVVRNRRLRTVTNIFVVSLAIADILVGVISVPLWMYFLISYDLTRPTLYLVYQCLDLFAGLASILHLLVISLERCYAVAYVIKHRNTSENVYYIVLVIVWISPAITSAFLAVVPSPWIPNYLLAVTILFFFVPLLFIMVAYTIIWKMANRRTLAHQNHAMKKDMRIAVTIAIVITFFVIAWLPFFTVQLLVMLCLKCFSSTSPEAASAVTLFVKFMHYSNSAVNPIIYSIKMPEFRRSFTRLLVRFCTRKRSNRVGGLTSSTVAE